ncbi:MAG: hypothetical protein NZL91_10230, partial [Thermoflexales bacterium]|nr:hypothetical protein [Thermoflexales bacterium]
LTERLNQLAARVDELTERLNQLTARVDELTERLNQLTARVDELTERLNQLTARVDELTERLNQLTARVDELTERLNQLTARVDQLAARVDQLAVRVDQLAQQMERMQSVLERHTQDLAKLRGKWLEMEYRDKAYAYFGGLVRRPRVISFNELWDELEANLTRDELRYLLALDLLVKGQLPKDQGGGDVLLAVEVSATIDERDVERVAQRAALLRRAVGMRVVPVVAGERLDENMVKDLPQRRGVVVVQDGNEAGWESALSAAL